MRKSSESAGLNHILKAVQLSSALGQPCEECRPEDSPDFLYSEPENVAAQISHYVETHGYELLHVGQQTGRDQAGHPWQTTVAIVGKPREIYQRYQ
jgi:hypothetical protein